MPQLPPAVFNDRRNPPRRPPRRKKRWTPPGIRPGKNPLRHRTRLPKTTDRCRRHRTDRHRSHSGTAGKIRRRNPRQSDRPACHGQTPGGRSDCLCPFCQRLQRFSRCGPVSGRTQPTESAQMKSAGEELAKLHCINSLFADLTGDDLYLAQQVKEAIEKSLEDFPSENQSNDFASAMQLLANHCQTKSRHCFAHWNCSGNENGFDPLWARLELISLFKKLAPCPRSTVVITDLRKTLCPPGRRWTKTIQREYLEAIALIEEIARNWSTPNAVITLLFF